MPLVVLLSREGGNNPRSCADRDFRQTMKPNEKNGRGVRHVFGCMSREPLLRLPATRSQEWSPRLGRAGQVVHKPLSNNSGRPGSNRQHSAWKADALPIELHPQIVSCRLLMSEHESSRCRDKPPRDNLFHDETPPADPPECTIANVAKPRESGTSPR